MISRAVPAWERTFERLGAGAYTEYRIPGIVVTEKGTIICCYEGRMSTRDDWAKIDTVICRSADDGATWEKRAVKLPREMGGGDSDTTNNPTLIATSDRVHLILHLNYARAFHMVSEDDGVSWSGPVEITDAFREFPIEWNVCATGPGHGICLENGRLVAPIWIANGEIIDEKRISHAPSWAGAIHSDDNGATWHAGALATGIENASETTIAELSDGKLLFNFRNTESDKRRRLAYSLDGGDTLGKAIVHRKLRDPICFGSMVSLSDGSVAFCNCDTEDGRTDVSLKISEDGGVTWRKIIHIPGPGGYADIAAFGNSIYILYETTEDGCISKMVLKKYTLD